MEPSVNKVIEPMLGVVARDWAIVMSKSYNDPEFMRGFRKWRRERQAVERASVERALALLTNGTEALEPMPDGSSGRSSAVSK